MKFWIKRLRFGLGIAMIRVDFHESMGHVRSKVFIAYLYSSYKYCQVHRQRDFQDLHSLVDRPNGNSCIHSPSIVLTIMVLTSPEKISPGEP